MTATISRRWGAPATPASEPRPPTEEISAPSLPEPQAEARQALIAEKVKLHGHIIEEFNLSLMEKISPEDFAREVRRFIGEYALRERMVLNQKELAAFADDVLDEMIGLGPIEPFLKDASVTDILINTHASVFVERNGQLEATAARFKDEAHLLRIVNKMVAAVGRRIDEFSPMVDARLPDGSRVNVAIRPVAIDGPLVSIRKFSKRPLSIERLIELGMLTSAMADVLKAAVRGRVSLVVSGGTGSGKTTMLNALSSFIAPRERLITIEDAAELQLQQPHVARLETRPPSLEGRGEIRQRELLRNALRMRPDRIVLGECRGEEAFDMLQAMNTGHEGSMTTVHANSPRDALSRIEQMAGMAAVPMSLLSIRSQIASALHLVLQLERQSDGKRRLTSLLEVTGLEGDVLQTQEIFRFVREGIDERQHVLGSFRATGIRPKFLAELKAQGVELPASYFDPGASL